MSGKRGATTGPRGGLRASPRALRGWKWIGRGRLISAPVRCKREEWYLARARLACGSGLRQANLLMVFLRDEQVIAERCLRLHAPASGGDPEELLGWIEAPDKATHLQLCVPDRGLVGPIEEIVFHSVSERDPKCHPMANVPRWDQTYRSPLPLKRVVLPATLSELADEIDWAETELVGTPASLEKLCKRARGAVCVIDPRWVTKLQMSWGDLERLASWSWVLLDLETTAGLVRRAKVANTEVVTHESAHGLMSARVDYADVCTRGLALQDVVPYALMDPDGGFRVRALKASTGWRRYADEVGFATLLSSETPWQQHHGDVLSAARAVEHGELIATDLPWLVTGAQGVMVAPRVARHLLRVHLGGPVDDTCQYWNRWDDGNVVVRDVGDFARRYAPLRTMRWAGDEDRVHLGLAVVPEEPPIKRQTMIRTGRIDVTGVHDGVPPEPMTIFMKWLAREVREGTEWARRHMAGHAVTWQFDARDGIKYAANFDSAAVLGDRPARTVCVRMGAAREGDPEGTLVLAEDEGLFGDASLAFQAELTRRLRGVIEKR